MKTELRFAGELRAAGTARIGGYAAVFDQPTQIGSFTEVIRKGAFTRALKESRTFVCS